MSSLTAQAEYLEDQALFIEEMNEYGRTASFGVRSDAGDEWSPSGDYVERGTANVFEFKWTRDFSFDVQENDLFFFVGAEVDIENCTVMLDSGNQYTIHMVKPFRPDQIVIFYEIQVRV